MRTIERWQNLALGILEQAEKDKDISFLQSEWAATLSDFADIVIKNTALECKSGGAVSKYNGHGHTGRATAAYSFIVDMRRKGMTLRNIEAALDISKGAVCNMLKKADVIKTEPLPWIYTYMDGLPRNNGYYKIAYFSDNKVCISDYRKTDECSLSNFFAWYGV